MLVLDNDNPAGISYIGIVAKDYSQDRAFEMLTQLRNEFERFFEVEKAKRGRPHSLTDEFLGTMNRIQVMHSYH